MRPRLHHRDGDDHHLSPACKAAGHDRSHRELEGTREPPFTEEPAATEEPSPEAGGPVWSADLQADRDGTKSRHQPGARLSSAADNIEGRPQPRGHRHCQDHQRQRKNFSSNEVEATSTAAENGDQGEALASQGGFEGTIQAMQPE